MDTSILLARIIGPTFLIIGIGALLNPAYYGAMVRNFVKDAELYYFSGALALITGIAILLFHNIWVSDWRVVITLIGWMSVVKGMGRILFPTKGAKYVETVGDLNSLVYIASAVITILGLWLSYEGYGL